MVPPAAGTPLLREIGDVRLGHQFERDVDRLLRGFPAGEFQGGLQLTGALALGILEDGQVQIARAQRGQREALIASLPDDPRVSAALRRFAETGPVVTLVTDIADSGSSHFIGPDDYRGGRIAGDLMGLLMRPEGGNVLMIGGHAENTGQRQRQAGFRAILSARHPEPRLVQVLETGGDGDLVGRMVEKALLQDGSIRGIYQASTGTQQICDAVQRIGRAEGMVIVAHELTPNRKKLLIERRLHAVIDQKPDLEARLAFDAVARLLGRLEGTTEPQAVETQIFMAESF